MVELIVIMVIIGVLAAFALPRLVSTGETAAIVFHDRVVSGLRLAQKTAVGHRRLVCVTTSSSALTIRIASSNGATVCNKSITGLDDADYANTDSAVAMTATTGLLGATLYFQPNGDITSDGAGATPVSGSFSVQASGVPNPPPAITIDGMTGYVE